MDTTSSPWKANYDTALGLPMYHENASVGKAVYALDLQGLNYDMSKISGINTSKQVPYEIILESSAETGVPFARPSEMHLF